MIHAAAAAVKSPIRMTASVEIKAKSKGPRSFTTLAYTGGLLEVDGYDLPIVVDLAGLEFAKSIVANLHHEKTQIVGHVTDPTSDGKQLALTGLISGTGAAAKEFTDNHDNGFPWDASIEALPTVTPTLIQPGQTVTINGQTFTGPLYHATKSKLKGVAFLPRGADENTVVTIAAGAADPDPKGTDMDFEKWCEALGFDAANPPTDKQKAALKAKYDAEVAAAAVKAGAKGKPAVPDIKAAAFDLDEIKAAASEFMVEIEGKLAIHEGDVRDKAKLAEIKAEALKSHRELKAKAITERWAATRLEVEAIKATSKMEVALIQAKAPTGPGIHSSTRDMSPPVIEAALCMSRGLPNIDKQFKPEVLDAAHKQFRGGLGLQQLVIMAAEANGYPGRCYSITQGNLRGLLEYAFPPRREIRAGGFSTIDLAGLLASTANKEILEGYMEEGLQQWKEISVEKNVPDFKAITSYRMLDDAKYEEMAPDGHMKHMALGEESYTRQAKTYAKMGQFTRTDFINDDMGAFDDLRTRIGRGGVEKLNEVVWAKFINNSSFFTAARGNYITGATTTLLTDGVGLELGVTAFGKLTVPGPNGTSRRKGGRATLLVVPPELEFNAERLYQSTNVGPGTTTANSNIHAGKYKPLVVPWLSDSNFTGYSTTAWYLLRNPSELPAVVVSYLNGVKQPTVETAEADFDQLGVQMRGYFDFGADQAEYLAGIKSKGAS